ncbi:hypothetical protein AQJ30_27585 [Streptomyces longwoodensis]|uniref:Uncharacterized protein n=1 Tax=Streptomyces longwoodensis TaxID=68231 RepID=A0A101QRS9_9ACTN|nr:hypothetical protein [Streptomyces longwoodensis]KUN34833.1 hypothetical protein AQJ30_27585 [Streptomyces longwoodensis]
MPNIDDILKRAKPRERTVRVCIRGDLASRVEQLAEELSRVSKDWEPQDIADEHPGRRIAADLKAAREAAQEAEVPFTLRYIGDRAYSDLVAAHPSDDEKELFDGRTFPRALIVASCVDPVMDEKQAAELFEVISQGEIEKLFQAAWDVHHSADLGPFSLAASALLAGLGGAS